MVFKLLFPILLACTTRIMLNRASLSDPCLIRVKICVTEGETGYIETNNIRLSSWSCDQFTTETFHSGYIMSTCKKPTIFSSISENFVDKLYDHWQEVPEGAYFILVSSTKGIAPLKELWQNVATKRLVSNLLMDFGLNTVDLNSDDESVNARGGDYTRCRDTVVGAEYRGTMNHTGSALCRNWHDTSTNRHHYTEHNFLDAGLEDGPYCRNPNHDPLGPWCFTTDGKQYCQVPYCNDTEGIAIISQRGNRENSKFWVVKEALKSRVIEYQFNSNPDACVSPLTSKHIYSVNPANVGLNNSSPDSLIDVGNQKLHLVKSDPIGCEHKQVLGWQFIAATPGRVHFTMAGVEDGERLRVRGTSTVSIAKNMTTAQEMNYVCIRDQPISGVRAGDQYGFFTGSMNQSTLPPLKRVVPIPYTTLRHPCSRQVTWSDVNIIDVYNLDASHINPHAKHHTVALEAIPSSHKMALALKPIFDTDFSYRCKCTSDLYCSAYGDGNMRCARGMCQCAQGYEYNRKANRCLYAGSALNRMTYQSSTLGNQVERYSGSKAVDPSKETNPFMGSVAATEPTQGGSWWVVDLGMSLSVHSVKITTPQALDKYLTIWSNKTKYDNHEKPDHYIYAEFNQDLSQVLSQEQEVIEVHGPFAWRLVSADRSQSLILNPDLTHDKEVYRKDGLGDMAESIEEAYRLHTGYLTTGQSCLGSGPNHNILLLHLSSGENCEDKSKGLRLFLHERLIGSRRFVMMDRGSRYVTVTQDRKRLTLGQNATEFILFSTLNRTEALEKLYQVSQDNRGLYIGVHGAGSVQKCLAVVNGSILLKRCDVAVSTRFYLDLALPPHVRAYDYAEVVWRPDEAYPEVVVSQAGHPCVQFDSMVSGTAVGASVTTDTFNVAFQGKDSLLARQRSSAVFKISESGVNDFSIGVATTFDGHNFYPQDFSKCTPSFEKEKTSVPPGVAFQIDCEAPVYGRYVAVYNNQRPDSVNQLILTDVQVYTLSECPDNVDINTCILQNRCDNLDHGCQQICRDVGDERFYECECHEGYQLNADGRTCSDIDECVTRRGGCHHTCVNDVPGFHCVCRQGYQPSNITNHCIDIDECALENGGCMHTCRNIDGSYQCTCNNGYLLGKGQRVCEGPNSVRLQVTVDMQYRKSLYDIHSADYKTISSHIQAELNQICSNQLNVDAECYIDGPLVEQYKGVMFELLAVLHHHLDIETQSSLGYQLKMALGQKVYLDLGGNRKHNIFPPIRMLYFTGQMEPLILDIESACFLYDGLDYCQHQSECEADEDVPVCACKADYFGADCSVYAAIKPRVDIEDVVGMSSYIGVMFFLWMFIVAAVATWYICKSKDLQQNTEEYGDRVKLAPRRNNRNQASEASEYLLAPPTPGVTHSQPIPIPTLQSGHEPSFATNIDTGHSFNKTTTFL